MPFDVIFSFINIRYSMNHLLIFIQCFLIAGLIAMLVAVSGQSKHQTVNAVIGDESFLVTFGHAPTTETTEAVRIRTHLTYVEKQLRQRSIQNLSPQLRSRRTKLLDHLRAYIQAGRFPVNDNYTGERRPCFIDRTGAICAVGYLVEQSAGRALAERVNVRYQYDRITDMHLPELDHWIAQSGLTVDECALIQPAYSGPPIYRTDNQVSTAYAVGSGILNAANITLGVLNIQQLKAGTSGAIVSWLGVAGGLGSVALGVANRPRGYELQPEKRDQPILCPCYISDLYTRNSTRDVISWTNIGVGAVSIVVSTWNLTRRHNDTSEQTSPRTRYGLAPLPGNGAIIQIAHSF